MPLIGSGYAPTYHPPGSAGLILVMAERARLGLPLFVDGDAKLPDAVGAEAILSRNGTVTRGRLLRVRQGRAGPVTEAVPGQVPQPPPRPPRKAKPSEVKNKQSAARKAKEAARKRLARARVKRSKELHDEAQVYGGVPRATVQAHR